MAKAATEDSLIERYRAFLKIDRDDLDTALIEQPDIFYRVAAQYALAVSRRDESKLDRDNGLAQVAQGIRDEAARANEKITEKAIADQLDQSPKTDQLRRDYIAACRTADEWLALKEAFQQRAYALKDLAGLYAANYFTTSSGGAPRREAVDSRADAIRAEGGAARRVRAQKVD